MNIEALLDRLCVDLGFCRSPDARRRLIEDPGADVDRFVDRVVVAEGLDLTYLDGRLRQQVRERVASALAPTEPPWLPEREKRRSR